MNLKEECPGLLHHVSGFPVDGKGTYLEQLVQNTLKIKQATCKTLDLVDGRLIVPTGDTITLNTPISVKLMKVLAPNTTELEIVHNKKGERKLSRIICEEYSGMTLKNWKSYPRMLDVIDIILGKGTEIMEELPKFRVMHDMLFFEGSHINIGSYIPTFVQNFYSEMAGKVGGKYLFSVNPLDIINAANSTAFTSCFNFDGQCSKGALVVNSFVNSGVISVISATNTCVGRAWVFFTEDFDTFFLMKSYGVLPKVAIDVVIANIIKKCGSEKSKWMHCPCCSDGDYIFRNLLTEGMYFDSIVGIYTTKENPQITLKETTPVCLKCGGPTASGSLFCSSCSGALIRCNKCRRLMWASPITSRPICDKCCGEQITCSLCGEVYPKKYKHCPECARSNVCYFCGNTKAANLIKFADLAACPTCVQLLSKGKCDACEAQESTYPYGPHALCLKCLDNASSQYLPHNSTLSVLKGAVK